MRSDGQAQLPDLLDRQLGVFGDLHHAEPRPRSECEVTGDRRESTGSSGFGDLLDAEPPIGEPLEQREAIGGVRCLRVVQPLRLELLCVHEGRAYEPSSPIASANAAHQLR